MRREDGVTQFAPFAPCEYWALHRPSSNTKLTQTPQASTMATSHKMLLNSATIAIDPEGDVVLLVGDTMAKARLLVSSKVLRLASSVFAAMLGPHFLEGDSLVSGRGCEIELPEDDPDAMTLICNCIHFRGNAVPSKVAFTTLKAFAILSDRYDFTKALSSWSALWLRRWELEDGFEDLLIVTYALDCVAPFAEISRRAILSQIGSFDTHRVMYGFHMIPNFLLGIYIRPCK